jgi:hypothetical protein
VSTAVADAPLPRADAVPPPPRPRGFFSFAGTSLRGLDPVFWALLVYLFVAAAALDEEWAIVAKFRPRLLLGGLILGVSVIRVWAAALKSKGGPAPPDAISAWWGAYVAATLLASLWAFDFGLALTTLLGGRLQTLLLFALLLVLVRTRRQLMLVVLVFSAGYGFYLLKSFWEFFNGRVYAKSEGIRMVGIGDRYADPNSFAATIVFSLPLIIWAGIHTRSWFLRFCVMCYGVLSVIAVVLTKSRAGFILLGLATLYFLFALPSRRIRIAALLLLAVGASVGFTFIPERTLARYRGLLGGSSVASDRESTEGRIEGYRIAWDIFRERPVFGVGPGNFAEYRKRRVDGDTMMPHNLAGLLIATLGLAGTITFTAYVLAAFARALRERRRRRGSADPWDRAMRGFIGAMAFTLLLLFVSGLAAHNLEREGWYVAPALILVAALARPEKVPALAEKEPVS